MDDYYIFRVVEDYVKQTAESVVKNEKEVKRLIEDLENLAYLEFVDRFGRYRDKRNNPWRRSARTKETRIRSDILLKVRQIVRGDDNLKSFLVNYILLEMCEECDGNPEMVQKKVGERIAKLIG